MKHIVNFENTTVILRGKPEPVLQHLNYQINAQDFVILLGSNGSGKSSLLKLLTKHYRPTQGTVKFLGKKISRYSDKTLSQHLKILTQDTHQSLFSSLTIYENYLLLKQGLPFVVQESQARDFLIRHLEKFNPNLGAKLNHLITDLSGGEKQALGLAFCLLDPPKLLLLDEHTSALDPKTSKQIMALTAAVIQQHHITCILTTHDLDIALNYGNRVLVLNEGKITQQIDSDKKKTLSKESLLTHYV